MSSENDSFTKEKGLIGRLFEMFKPDPDKCSKSGALIAYFPRNLNTLTFVKYQVKKSRLDMPTPGNLYKDDIWKRIHLIICRAGGQDELAGKIQRQPLRQQGGAL